MPNMPIKVAAGVNTEATEKDAEPQWVDCNRIRFDRTYVESLGGWVSDNANTINGVPRGIISWVTLRAETFIGLGTHKRLLIWQGGSYTDITPVRATGTMGADPFSTTAASDIVTVVHTGHNVTVGDGVNYSGATVSPIDSTDVTGDYEVLTVPDANTYTIQLSAAVTTTEANFGGASVTYTYQINVGQETTVPAYGWGADGWGVDTWGTPRSAPVGTIAARLWQLDQWGEDLIANVRGGAIYVWDSSAGLATPAAIISGAPATAKLVLVSPTERHLVGFGVHDGTADDPLLIQWSTSADYTDWDVTSTTNSAGELRIERGTEIIGAIRTRGQMLVLTDISAHSMFTTGTFDVFGIDLLGEGCGLIAQHAISEHAGLTFWMGLDNFYAFDGVVRILECDVWTYVYEDINLDQSVKFHSSTNVRFNEVWWFYCSSGSDEIDRYVKYNWADKAWDYGEMDRTTWIDPSDGSGITQPYATDANGSLFIHENGVNADGAAMGSMIDLYDMDITQEKGADSGGAFFHIRKFLPDFKYLTGSISLTINTKSYPQSTATAKGPYTILPTDLKVSVRGRGRQIGMKFEQSDVDDSFRFGTHALQITQHGRR